MKRPRRESIARPKERSFYGHMRNNQNLPNRKIDSNNFNGRQLPPTSPIYNNSRSRNPYRSQSRNNYNNNVNPRDDRNYKDIGNHIITITEVQVKIETFTVEAEETATIEITIITDTIVDQVQDIRTETTQDNNHHITEIIITITITDKDITAEIQTETTDLDNVQVVTIEITQTTITETTGEIHHKENKIKGITLQNDEMKEINITIIITKTE